MFAENCACDHQNDEQERSERKYRVVSEGRSQSDGFVFAETFEGVFADTDKSFNRHSCTHLNLPRAERAARFKNPSGDFLLMNPRFYSFGFTGGLLEKRLLWRDGLVRRIFMETSSTTRGSFFGLIGHFRQEVMRLIRQEVELAKTEIMEKVSKMMRNAVFAAAGGMIALLGAELLCIGIGVIIGYAIQQAGLEPGLSYAIGIGGFGIVIALIGAAFLMKGIKAFNAKSLAPQHSIDTMRELAGKPPMPKVEPREKEHKHNGHHKSSDELRKEFEQTRHEVERTAAELKQRANVGAAVTRQVNSHPVRTLAAGLATGYLGGRVLKNRMSGPGRAERRTEKLQKRVERLEHERPMRRTLLGRLLARA
jgi:hypothetical protein